jgi:hypothetical protein
MNAHHSIQGANSEGGAEPPPNPSRFKRIWSHPYGKALTILLSGLAISQVAFTLGFRTIGSALSILLTALTGWAFFGHFITIDDDMPGEWSNPEGSRTLWRRSLLELLAKFVVFAIVGIFMAAHFES